VLRICAAVVAAAILLLCWERTTSLAPQREDGSLSIDPPTPYYRFSPDNPMRGRVLVVHGLDASKNFMQVFCAAIADAGFEVYAIDLPGHGDSTVGFDATLARTTVGRVLDHLGTVDVVIGHSLGAGLVMDLANERDFNRLVLLSPPPAPVDTIDLTRTLVVTGEWDIPAVNAFVARLEGVEWWRLPWAAHSSAVFNDAQTRDIVRWMGGNPLALRTSARVGWSVTMVIAAIVLGTVLLPATRPLSEPLTLSIADAGGWFGLAGAVTVIVLWFWVVLDSVRLFATDYLVSAVFVMGILLITAKRLFPRMSDVSSSAVPGRKSALIVAVAAAAYVIVVVGFFAGSHFMHFALTAGRWWRFAVIAFAGFPLFLFDETTIRNPGNVWKSTMTGLLTRVLLGASILTGVLLLNREDAFLVLIIHLMVLLWMVLWFLTEIVRRHTQDPVAAALFSSLVQGWIFAAWFVTT
jgi:pimeloyl-ACP methyl ester carboxylesterase